MTAAIENERSWEIQNLSTIYYAMNQDSTAREYAQKAVAILQALFPNGHPNLETAKQNLETINNRLAV